MLSYIAPYASFLVAHSTSVPVDPKLFTDLLTKKIAPSAGWKKESDLVAPAFSGIDFCGAYHYLEETPPRWLAPGSGVLDSLNHLFAVFIKGDCAVIYTSSGEIKDAIFDALDSGAIPGWAPIEENVLLQAYVTGRTLRMLWLAGTHRNVTVKPNSKFMTGDDLADTIDPFGDSTFLAGALRAEKAGVSLKRSGVWFGKRKDWNHLCLTAASVLNAVQIASATPGIEDLVVHEGLARLLRSFKGVGPAADIEWVPPESIESERRREKLAGLVDSYDICIAPSGHANECFEIEITHLATMTSGVALITPALNGKKISLAINLLTPAPLLDTCSSVLSANPDFVRVLYDSGHSIVSSRLSFAIVQDRNFDLTFADFLVGSPSQYDVWKEKPPGNPPPIGDIFKSTDRSLFKWVFKEGLAQLGLSQPTPGACWLYCDDRSGEVADFIHLDTARASGVARITLFHVKGASAKKHGSRRISTSAYEVVVAQAMKNLRRMAWSELHKAIKKTVEENGADRTWDQPWSLGLTSTQAVADAMLAAIGAAGAKCEYEVIVVQPHVQKDAYLPKGLPAKGPNASQLRNLLFTAKAAASVALAEFRVVVASK